MIKTLDYRIAESNNGDLFRKFIMKKLNEGYKLFGTPFIRSDSYCQCLVKVERSSEFEKVQQVIKSFIDIEKGEKRKIDNGPE